MTVSEGTFIQDVRALQAHLEATRSTLFGHQLAHQFWRGNLPVVGGHEGLAQDHLRTEIEIHGQIAQLQIHFVQDLLRNFQLAGRPSRAEQPERHLHLTHARWMLTVLRLLVTLDASRFAPPAALTLKGDSFCELMDEPPTNCVR